MTIEEIIASLVEAADEVRGLEQIPDDERTEIADKIHDAVESLDECYDNYGDGGYVDDWDEENPDDEVPEE